MSKTVITLPAGVGGFNEDKDEAKRIRNFQIMPALDKGHGVVLDFKAVTYSTQSFMHALIGSALNKYKEPGLDRIEFKNCAPQVKSLVQLVVDYSLGGFQMPEEQPKPKARRPIKR